MTGLRTVLVVLCCCLAPLSMAPVVGDAQQPAPDDGPAMAVTPVANTTEYLAIRPGHVENAGQMHGDVDVAAAVGGGAGAANAQFATAILDERMRTAENDTAEAAAISRMVERVGDRILVLEDREARAVRAYNDGTIDATSLARTLVAIDAEARALDDAAVYAYERNQDLSAPTVTTAEITDLRNRLIPLYGPVRQHLGDGASGGVDTSVYVETAGENLTLATVRGDRYVREAHFRDARDPDGADDLGFGGFEQRVQELYPWTYASSGPSDFGAIGGLPYFHNANVYAAGLGHTHGPGATSDLVTYIDGSTADVFFETQQTYPDRVPVETSEIVEGDLRLILETTRAGGPLGVSVVDVTTDEPVDAEVELLGRSIGSTGGEQLWTVAPRGTVTVNATYGGQTVSSIQTIE